MRSRVYLFILAAGLVSACAPFGASSDLEQRVDEQDIRLRQMQPQQAETMNEVQAMRQEIAQLKGQIAAMNQQPGGQSQTPVYQPHTPVYQPDMPIRQADAGSPAQSGASGSTYEPVTGITPNPRNAPDSSAYDTGAATQISRGQGGNYGLSADTPVEPVKAPTEDTWGKADPVPAAQVEMPKKDISLALFDSGINDFNARKYAEAEKSFRDFLKTYPNHSQAAEAQYYLAETQFQRNRFPDAALAYDTVIKKYPKSSSAAGAMLKQGIAFSKMGQGEAARARMQQVISKYPNSPEAARAKTFLKTNK